MISYDVYYKKQRIDGTYLGLVESFSDVEEALLCAEKLNHESLNNGTYHIQYLVIVERDND